MAIHPTKPISRPALNPNKIWIKHLVISAPSPTEPIVCDITLVPWDESANVLVNELTKNVTLTDVYAEAIETVEVSQAVEAIYNAVQKVVQKREVY